MFEMKPIGQAVIAHVAEPIFRPGGIRDLHTTLPQMGNLLLVGERWLGVVCHYRACLDRKVLKTKDPPSVHVLADRGRAGAIALQIGRTSPTNQ